MAPKSATGQWVEPFDPKLGGGQGGHDYFTEMDSWVYTFAVQYDVAGLIHRFGSRDAFKQTLDQRFVEQYGTSKFSPIRTGAALPRMLRPLCRQRQLRSNVGNAFAG